MHEIEGEFKQNGNFPLSTLVRYFHNDKCQFLCPVSVVSIIKDTCRKIVDHHTWKSDCFFSFWPDRRQEQRGFVKTCLFSVWRWKEHMAPKRRFYTVLVTLISFVVIVQGSVFSACSPCSRSVCAGGWRIIPTGGTSRYGHSSGLFSSLLRWKNCSLTVYVSNWQLHSSAHLWRTKIFE